METTGPVSSAPETASRLLENVETVVHGKRRRSGSCWSRSRAGAMCSWRTSPARRRPCSRARSPGRRGRGVPAVQCTPDLQPTDVTGLSVFDQNDRDFDFRPGPVFANVVLVDEINRAMPKTQSALLEAMAEQQVTIDGVTRPLPRPSCSSPRRTRSSTRARSRCRRPSSTGSSCARRSATRTGTTSARSCASSATGIRSQISSPVITVDELRTLQRVVEDVYLDELIQSWIIDLVGATRQLDGSRSARPSAAASPSSVAPERSRFCTGATSSARTTSRRSSCPSLGHRIVFTTRFLIEQRRRGGDSALEAFRDLCFARGAGDRDPVQAPARRRAAGATRALSA